MVDLMKKIRNWFYYYKWYLVAGIAALFFVVQWAGNLTGVFEKKPDVQVACICRRPLSAEALAFLEKSFAEAAGDYNGDGTVKAAIHFYLTSDENSVAEAQQSAAAAEISLVGDINDCESYFFLMDDPDTVQVNWQILADMEGNCPAPTDYSTTDKTVSFSDLPFTDPALLSPEESGISEEDLRAMASLRLGHRCFYSDRQCRYADRLALVWSALTGRAQR